MAYADETTNDLKMQTMNLFYFALPLPSPSGSCYEGEFIKDKSSCRNSGYVWLGFDISGHCFLLVFSNLVILEEVKVFKVGKRICIVPSSVTEAGLKLDLIYMLFSGNRTGSASGRCWRSTIPVPKKIRISLFLRWENLPKPKLILSGPPTTSRLPELK